MTFWGYLRQVLYTLGKILLDEARGTSSSLRRFVPSSMHGYCLIAPNDPTEETELIIHQLMSQHYPKAMLAAEPTSTMQRRANLYTSTTSIHIHI